MGRFVPVVFRFPGRLATGASRVTLSGMFTWMGPAFTSLTRRPGGDWVTTIYLPPGGVVYCFYVNAAVWLDPDDDGRVSNS